MAIRSSKVTSSALFNRQRKRRLSSANPKDSETSAPDNAREDDVSNIEPTATVPERVQPVTEEPNEPTAVATPSAAAEPEDRAGTSSSNDAPTGKLSIPRRSPEDPAAGNAPEPEVASRRKNRRAKAQSREDNENARFKLHIAVASPAPGSSPTFDRLVRIQGEKAALRAVLTKALELFFASVADGTHTDAPMTYAEGTLVSNTTRFVPRSVYDICEQEWNEMGLISERAMGKIIGRHAVALFVHRDKG